MKKLYILLFIPAISFSQSNIDTLLFYQDLNYANLLYNNNREEAKEYYIKAANNGSADAHFYLAYRYVVTQEDAIYHFSEAARKGHERALGYALDYLFFRGNNLILSNPKEALSLYYTVKNINPDIKLYDEENKLEVLKIASLFDLLDGEEFINKYNLKDNSSGYYIWELAEKASHGEIFENPSSDLVMQLIIKGGHVPAETQLAVKDYYSLMSTSNDLVPFSLCNYITSGFGQGYCASKYYDEWILELKKEIDHLSYILDLPNISLINDAYEATIKYIEDKAFYEEGHDGSGFVAWAYESIIDQQRSYLDLIRAINNGYIPEISGLYESNDKVLNEKYNDLLNKLELSPIRGMRFSVSDEDLRHVQRLWISYRNVNTELFMHLSKIDDRSFWYNYFTVERIKDFDYLQVLSKDYSTKP